MLTRLLFLTAATVMHCACGGENSAPFEKNADATNSAIENVDTAPTAILSGGEAVVTFGNENLDAFSTIKCRARPDKSRFRVTASGKYQGERVRVVLNTIGVSRQGAVALNIRGEMWQLLEGNVELTEDGTKFVASGTLRGKRMDRQEDGTSKLVPLHGANIKSFRITIKCL